MSDGWTPARSSSPEIGRFPVPLTRFIGRRGEIARVRALLGDGRLVTLTGGGGIGKSRLALEVGRRHLPELHGRVWWLDLSAAAGRPSIEGLAGRALRLRDVGGRSSLDTILAGIGPEPGLLVLDECESVLEPAASFAAALLRGHAALRILATSRIRLGISGEVTYQVPPLGSTGGRGGRMSVERDDAVALFVHRVRMHDPGFTMTNADAARALEICHRLDGMPLAIELAAARTRHIDLEALARRLDDQPSLLVDGARDLPDRQRSIAAAVDWSYRLLSPAARRVFCTVAVPPDGFDAPMAMALDRRQSASTIEGAIVELAEHSLVVSAGPKRRYRLLEPVRQHALALLRRQRRELRLRRRLSAYAAAIAGAWAASAWTHLAQDAAARLDVEYDNVLAALEWSLGADSATALDIAADLASFWGRRGLLREGRAWLGRALDAAPAHPRRYAALAGLAELTLDLGDLAACRPLVEAALEGATSAGDAAAAARARIIQGNLAAPDHDRIRVVRDEAIASTRESGREEIICRVDGAFADLEWVNGDPDEAVALARRALDLAHRLGIPALALDPAAVLARAATFTEDPGADALWKEYLRHARALDDSAAVRQGLLFVALRAAWRGDRRAAVEGLRELARLDRQVGSEWSQMRLVEAVGLVLLRLGRPLEGLRLVFWKEYATGPDWIDSPAWWGHVRSEVERALPGLETRLRASWPELSRWSVDEALSVAEEQLAVLASEGDLPIAGSSARRERQAIETDDRWEACLTSRQREVLDLVAEGWTNAEIGRRLRISPETVRKHLENTYLKLEVNSRIGALARTGRAPADQPARSG